jgi:hypothetical protein
MTRDSWVRAALALAALALVPAHAPAQAFVGVGVGMENVRDQTLGQQRVGPMLHARAGVALSGRTAVMLEGAWHGMGDDQASV